MLTTKEEAAVTIPVIAVVIQPEKGISLSALMLYVTVNNFSVILGRCPVFLC